jgi:hypothetical protein
MFRTGLLLLAALGFVALGLFFVGAFGPVPRPGQEWVGWTSIPFFGLCFVVGLPRLFDRRDQIVIDGSGIQWCQWSEATIPWSAIRAIEKREIRRQKFLCLHLEDPGRFPPSTMTGRLGGANRILGFGDIALATTGTNRGFDDLVAAIVRHAPSRLATDIH